MILRFLSVSLYKIRNHYLSVVTIGRNPQLRKAQKTRSWGAKGLKPIFQPGRKNLSHTSVRRQGARALHPDVRRMRTPNKRPWPDCRLPGQSPIHRGSPRRWPLKTVGPRVNPHTMVALAPMVAPFFTSIGFTCSLRGISVRGLTMLVDTMEGPQNTPSRA